MERTIVLDSNYSFLNVINWKRAICLMVKGKVDVLKYTDRVISNAERTVQMKVPAVIKLIKIIRSLYRNKVPFSKRNVMIRDGFACAYCGSTDALTIEHILPASRGGKSTFENCVAACTKCNSHKSNRTPSEAKMYLKKQPYAPTIAESIKTRMEKLGVMDLLRELGVY